MHVEQLKAEEDQIAAGDNTLNKTEDDDMESQLNPDAKEFVPTSPIRSTPISPFNNGGSVLQVINNDRILAQSPRKNGSTPMENIEMPSEDDFINDIEKRPADVDDGTNLDNSFTEFKRPGSSSSANSYEELNLKEAKQVDEKIQEYGITDSIMAATPSAPPSEEISSPIAESIVDSVAVLTNGSATTPSDVGNANYIDLLTQSHREQDPMGVSFYDDGTNATANPFEPIDLNAVHVLPEDQELDFESDKENNPNFVQKDENLITNGVGTGELVSPQQDVHDEISKPEDDQYTPVSETKGFDDMLQSNNTQSYHLNESDVPESELMIADAAPIIEAADQVDLISGLNALTMSDATLSPQFEAEHFVESIKEAQSDDKYTESGLSPNAEEFRPFGVANGDEFLVSDLSSSDVKESPIEDSAESDVCLLENLNQLVTPDEHDDFVAKTPETTAADEKDTDLDLIDEAAESDTCMLGEAQLISMPEASQPDLIVIPSDPVGFDETEMVVDDRQPAYIESQQVDTIKITTEDIVSVATDPVPTVKEECITETVAPSQESDIITASMATEVAGTEPIEPMMIPDVLPVKSIVDDTNIPSVSAEDAARAAAAVAAATALTVAAGSVATKKTNVSQIKPTAKKADTKSTKAPLSTVPTKKATTTTLAPKSAPLPAKAPVKAASLTSTTAKAPPPIARPRTVVSSTSTKAGAIEKKPTTSATSGTAAVASARKPLANGEVKSNQSVLNLKKTSSETKTNSATAAVLTTKSSATTTITKTTTARSTLITKSAPSKPTTILVTRTGATTRFVVAC